MYYHLWRKKLGKLNFTRRYLGITGTEAKNNNGLMYMYMYHTIRKEKVDEWP